MVKDNVPREPQALVLFGIPFHDVTFEETIDWCVRRMRSGRPACLATANVDFLMQAAHDPELQRILLEADLVIADGMPIVWLARRFGPALRERVTGSDLTPLLAAACAREGLSLFLLGGAPGVAEKAAATLVERNPGLQVAGTHSPPLAGLLDLNHADILARLRQGRPHLLLVAFGAPKQEKFINLHLRKWQVPLAVGVGGTLDFLAGTQTRAPRWVQRIGFEWLWRMGTNPRRLFRRYASNIRFMFGLVRKLEGLRRLPYRPPAEDRPQTPWPELEKQSAEADSIVVFDLGSRDWLDSREMGRLVQAARKLRQRGSRLLVRGGTPRVQQLIAASNLTTYLEYHATASEAEARRAQLESYRRWGAVWRADGRLNLLLPAELNTATLPRWAAQVEAVLSSEIRAVQLDAAGMEFLDSAGLGWMIALRKRCQDARQDFACVGLQGAPLQTIRLARVDACFCASS